ncbi:MAG: hypothetical protein J0665_12580 [Deltaproteobacteria bacterium]|nr:hypothetical protein [Deltaproteobacteria bacterium]
MGQEEGVQGVDAVKLIHCSYGKKPEFLKRFWSYLKENLGFWKSEIYYSKANPMTVGLHQIFDLAILTAS